MYLILFEGLNFHCLFLLITSQTWQTFLFQYKYTHYVFEMVSDWYMDLFWMLKKQANMLTFNLPVMELETKFSATYNAVQRYFSDACCEKLGYVK